MTGVTSPSAPNDPPVNLGTTATVRLIVSAVVGSVVGIGASFPMTWRVGLLLGWLAAAGLFVGWMWWRIGPMDAAATEAHATREEPSRSIADAIFTLASIASLGAVALLLLGGVSEAGGRATQAALSFAAVACGWATVHTLYAVRYARIYYSTPRGGIDFNTNELPRYTDFAYLSFTIGMAFQVSDTNIETAAIRLIALRHSLISYVFGAGIIATMINLVAGLKSSGG